jgi:hypothetical protein
MPAWCGRVDPTALPQDGYRLGGGSPSSRHRAREYAHALDSIAIEKPACGLHVL